MGIGKFSIWLNIPSKYLEDCFYYCGYIFRKINWHILSRFFHLCFGISLAVVKTDVKCLTEKSFFFSRNGLPFFGFDLCHICLLSATWVLFLKRKLPIAFCEFMLRKLHIYNNFFRSRQDFVLSLQTLELVQTKSTMSSHLVRFSSAGILNLSNKEKANYFDWKIKKKMLKLTKLMTQILS